MNENVVLTPERILEVTEDVLRRYGLAKATVVDVARALDVVEHEPHLRRCLSVFDRLRSAHRLCSPS